MIDGGDRRAEQARSLTQKNCGIQQTGQSWWLPGIVAV
jgi:hypothetical protein